VITQPPETGIPQYIRDRADTIHEAAPEHYARPFLQALEISSGRPLGRLLRKAGR
jgi:hypothetical protein